MSLATQAIHRVLLHHGAKRTAPCHWKQEICGRNRDKKYREEESIM